MPTSGTSPLRRASPANVGTSSPATPGWSVSPGRPPPDPAHADDDAVGRGPLDQLVERAALALAGHHQRPVLHEAVGVAEVGDVLPGGAPAGGVAAGDRLGPPGVAPPVMAGADLGQVRSLLTGRAGGGAGGGVGRRPGGGPAAAPAAAPAASRRSTSPGWTRDPATTRTSATVPPTSAVTG